MLILHLFPKAEMMMWELKIFLRAHLKGTQMFSSCTVLLSCDFSPSELKRSSRGRQRLIRLRRLVKPKGSWGSESYKISEALYKVLSVWTNCWEYGDQEVELTVHCTGSARNAAFVNCLLCRGVLFMMKLSFSHR